MTQCKPPVAVIGGGPAGLAAAEVLASGGAAVTVIDRMPSLGRKFLMAGRGGLNLTHAEPLETFLDRYGPARGRLEAAVRAFDAQAMRDWAAGLGIETFTGSSGRVFPRQMKASPLLRAWLGRLEALGVTVRLRTRWTGWEGAALALEEPRGRETLAASAVVLACGGASWPRLGSDGAWTALVGPVAPLAPANCGFTAAWSPEFAARWAGQPLKGAAFGAARLKGEIVITASGVEGGAVYALSSALRDALAQGGAVLAIDLKPDIAVEKLAARLAAGRPGLSLSNRLRRAGVSALGAALARETLAGPPPRDPGALAAHLKALPLRLSGTAGMARAISTAGGLAFDALDAQFLLKARPGVFAAGEMLDWEAPTGGYLLQGCIATGRAAGAAALAWLARGADWGGAPD